MSTHIKKLFIIVLGVLVLSLLVILRMNFAHIRFILKENATSEEHQADNGGYTLFRKGDHQDSHDIIRKIPDALDLYMKIKKAEEHDKWTINTTTWSKETKSRLKNDICKAFDTPRDCANKTSNLSSIGFIHIPKTGGESMEAFLGVEKSHKIGMNRVSDNPLKIYFSTVRDPYTRMESWFRFCLHGYHGKNLPLTYENQQTAICRTARKLTADVQTIDQMKIAFEEFLYFILIYARDLWVTASTSRYLLTDDGQLIPKYLLRFEDLAEETKRVLECGLGVHKSTTSNIQHLNGSGNDAKSKSSFPFLTDMLSSKDAAFWYTDRSWCMIQWAFEVDIELFDSHNWLYHQRSPCHIK